jgi:4-carboxymuconolactone decarboxylase
MFTAAALSGVMLLVASFASAQDRMPPIPPETLTEAQRAAVSEFVAARGEAISGPFVPLLRSPEVLSRARGMSDYLRFKSVLPPRLRELVILLTARQWTQQYEWNAHYPLAVKAGLNPAILKAIAEGRRPEAMAQDEQTVYEFCGELQRNQSVSDQTYARMVALWGEQGVIDAVGLAGYYTLIAMVLNTARTPLPPGAAPALAAFPR